MKNKSTAKSREALKSKMAEVFSGNLKTLSPDLQDVLLDDIVTALENRLTILNREQQNTQFVTVMTESAKCETLQA